MDGLLGEPEQLGVGGELGVGLEDLGLGRTGHFLDRLAQLAELGLRPSQRRTQAGGLLLRGPRPLPRQLVLRRRPRCQDEGGSEGGPGRRWTPGQPDTHGSSASPMPDSISWTSPANASSAPSPVVRMRISSPWWQSSVRTESTDLALTSFSPFASATSAEKDAAARAKTLAGRAWSPVGLPSTTVASATGRSLGGPSDRRRAVTPPERSLQLDRPDPDLFAAQVCRPGHGRAREDAGRGAPGHALPHRLGPLAAGGQEPRQQRIAGPNRAPGNHHAVL